MPRGAVQRMPEPSGNTVAFDSGLTDLTFSPPGRRMCSTAHAAVESSAKRRFAGHLSTSAASYCIW